MCLRICLCPYLYMFVSVPMHALITCCFTSAEVLRIVKENGGKATATSLSTLKQKHRALTVPLTIHPTTSTKKRSTQITTTNVSVFRSFISKGQMFVYKHESACIHAFLRLYKCVSIPFFDISTTYFVLVYKLFKFVYKHLFFT